MSIYQTIILIIDFSFSVLSEFGGFFIHDIFDSISSFLQS